MANNMEWNFFACHSETLRLHTDIKVPTGRGLQSSPFFIFFSPLQKILKSNHFFKHFRDKQKTTHTYTVEIEDLILLSFIHSFFVTKPVVCVCVCDRVCVCVCESAPHFCVSLYV